MLDFAIHPKDFECSQENSLIQIRFQLLDLGSHKRKRKIVIEGGTNLSPVDYGSYFLKKTTLFLQ